MKKVFKFLLFSILLIGCSKEDEPVIKEISFNPPEWLMGRWELKDSDDGDWVFSKENVVLTTYYGDKTDFKSIIESQLNWDVNDTQEKVKTERGSDSEYRIDIHTYGGHILGYSTNTWWFTKISQDEMRFSFAGSGRSDTYVRDGY